MAPRARAGLLGLVLALGMTACGGDDDDGDVAATPTTTATATGWSGPPRAADDGTIDVAAFEQRAVAVQEPWERAPLTVATEFLRPDEREPSAASIEVVVPPEGGETARVVATFDRLLDDSIRAQRYELELTKRADGTWRLRSARYAQRCQLGRGHDDFTPAACL